MCVDFVLFDADRLAPEGATAEAGRHARDRVLKRGGFWCHSDVVRAWSPVAYK